MNLGQRRLRLADFKVRTDAAVQTFLRQVEDLFLLVQGRLSDIKLGVMQRQLDIGAHHVVLQFELGLTRFGDAHVGHVHGLFGGIAFTAPQVEGKAQAQCGVVIPGRGVVECARPIKLIGRPVMAFERGVSIDLQRLGRLGHARHRLGLTHPGSGHGHARAALHREADPGIQLGVAIGVPPLGFGPVCVFRGACNRLVSGQRIGGQHLAFGADATKTDTAV